MPIFLLDEEPVFPHPLLAEKDGLLAVGGDLSVDRLITAYQHGIFPWYNPEEEIYWWAPNPRFVLYPEKLKYTKSFRSFLNNKAKDYQISFNEKFSEVIHNCKTMKRASANGTWITDEMEEAYIKLHSHGYACSFEVNNNEKLVAGLYGVYINNNVFCGESMFHTESNTGKLALYALVQFCMKIGTKIIDAQMHTDFFEKMGAEFISLSDYLNILHADYD